MKIADAHIHMHKCNMKSGTEFFDNLYEKGVTDIAIQALSMYHGYSDFENIYALCLKEVYKKINVYVFGSIHEEDEFGKVPYEKQLEWLMNAGCDGIKFITMKPNVRKRVAKSMNHPSYDKVLSMMEERGIPALIHSKDPANFWHKEQMLPHQVERGWCYEGKGFESYEDLHAQTLEMLDKHPKLKVILAHLFFLSDNILEAERIMEKYPNIYLDITPGTEMYENFAKDIFAWRDFFIKYQDRIIFGTDADDKSYEENADDLYRMITGVLKNDTKAYQEYCYIDLNVKGFNLPETVIDKILYKNFKNFMGSAPCEVDCESVKKAAQYVSKYTEDTFNFDVI